MKKLGAGFFFSLFAWAPSVHAHPNVDLFWDSMAFAIQHFNADHSNELRVFTLPQKYMSQALQAISTAAPGIEYVTELNDLWRDRKDPFQNLQFTIKSNPATAQEQNRKIEKTKVALENIFGACPKDHAVEMRTLDYKTFDNPFADSQTRTTYYVDQRSSKAPKVCIKDATIAKIAETGVYQVEVTDTLVEQSKRTFVVRFSLAVTDWRDMQYIKSRLIEIPSLKEVATQLELIDYRSLSIGKWRGIRLKDSTGRATIQDPVRFDYSLGWKDCTAGCRFHHYWTVEATPTLLPSGEFKFDVKILSERGDPVPSNLNPN
ncbi:hypothetical protein K2X30_04285 [bacterium]|nr:hypothetical protein [bacterium]